MTDRGRRFGKGVAIALAVHIIAAALLGVLGYRFTQRPPQILEVTLGGGGGGGGKGNAAAVKGVENQQPGAAQQQVEKTQPARPKADDIVDQKQKPQQQEQQRQREPERPWVRVQQQEPRVQRRQRSPRQRRCKQRH